MRGRPLLAAALALLALAPSAQAFETLAASGGSSPSVGFAGADEAMAKDVCIDVNSAVERPTAIVVIAAQCTVHMSVSVGYTEEGGLVITIVVAYAGHAHEVVVECSEPDRLPKVGDTTEKDASCWSLDEWLQID